MKKQSFSPEQQQELKELLDAVRRAGYAEGYAAAQLELVMKNDAQVVHFDDAQQVKREAEEIERVQTEEIYVSRTPYNTTQKLAYEYLKGMNRPVGPTEIIRNTQKAKGIRLTMTTLRRALEGLADRGEIEEVDNSRWVVAGRKK